MLNTIKNQIASDLRSRLLANEWAAGTRLKEAALAKEFGVSRGPIRDVVLELTKEGYLRMTPNCGVTVAGFPESRARQIYVRTRRDLEVLALKQGFAEWTPSQMDALGKLLRHFKLAAESQDLPTVIEHDLQFHRFIIEQYVQEDLLIVWTPLLKTVALPYSRHSNLMDTYDEHAAIYEALRLGDVAEAIKLLKKHIQ